MCEHMYKFFLYLGFTLPPPSYDVQVAEMARGSGKWGVVGQGHVIFFLYLYSFIQQTCTKMALKRGYQTCAKHLQKISLLCLPYLLTAHPHTAASAAGMHGDVFEKIVFSKSII